MDARPRKLTTESPAVLLSNGVNVHGKSARQGHQKSPRAKRAIVATARSPRRTCLRRNKVRKSVAGVVLIIIG